MQFFSQIRHIQVLSGHTELVDTVPYRADRGHFHHLCIRADITNYRKVGGLKHQKLLFSQFWMLEV